MKPLLDFIGQSLVANPVTAPCEERIDDNFIIKLYNPEQEKRSQFIKYGIVVGVAGVFGLLIGRWWGGHQERKHQEEQRRRR
jgi:hypothetical protein